MQLVTDNLPAWSLTLPSPQTNNSPNTRRFPTVGGRNVLLGVWGLLLMMALASQADALVRFDFEQKYFQHRGRQVWDFSIIRPDSIYHIFYHTINEQTPSATFGDTIWHATSEDLKHWDSPVAVIVVGQGPWDDGAIWAPDVFRDEGNNRWVIAYTGCDANFNQSICLAFSNNLMQWTKSVYNPVAEADTAVYVWDKNGIWSDFRDPYIYRQDNQWHMLVTAEQNLGINTGVLYHGTSDDLLSWTDVGPLFVNDGATPGKVLESPQYKVIGTTHHLLFGEFNTTGTTILSAADPSGWTMANRVLLDYGYAPEVDEFDPGVRIFSRLANYYLPDGVNIGYVVRIDTLLTDPDGSNPSVYKPHPMDDNWVVHSGTSNLANPTFGDNPIWRGEATVGLVGHGYYGSKEYHQGPLSGRGSPGTMLGDAITGTAESYRFPITGDRMTLLVGGGNYPGTCYVALVDDADDSILYSETGGNNATMTPREWDLTPYQGRTCYVAIIDLETGAMGHINVDEIIEIADPTGVQDDAPALRPTRHGAFPNPFNPRTTISFDLAQANQCEVRVHDLRGHLVWRSGAFAGLQGANGVVWDGQDATGSPAAAGTYLYAIEVAGQARASGKIALVK